MDVFSYTMGSKNIFVPKEGNPVVFYDKKSVDAAIGKVTEISDNISSTTSNIKILIVNSYLKKVENAYEKAKTMAFNQQFLWKQNKVLKNSIEIIIGRI